MHHLLKKEIELLHNSTSEINYDNNTTIMISSIHIGDGTPSLAPTSSINQIIQTIKETFTIDANIEITMEMDPGTFNSKQLYACKNTPSKTSSYPILFDTYYYKRCPLEILSSKDNATLLSLLSTDRMIDNYNNDEDGIMNELHNVDISISNASSKTNHNSSSTTVKDEKSMIMELLHIDQLIDKQQQLQQTT